MILRIKAFFLLVAVLTISLAVPCARGEVTLTTLVSFNGTNGSDPSWGSLIQGGDGNFYGTTYSFGAATTNVSTYSVGGSVTIRSNIYTYASNGVDLLTVTNALGIQVSSSSYGTNHQILTNYNALGEQTVYTYNATQQPTTVTRPTGLVTTNAYDGNGLLTTTYDYAVIGGGPVYYRTNSYTYVNDLVLTHTDDRGLVTTNTYDNLQRLTNAADLGGAISYIYTNLDLVKVTDRMGFATSYSYDSMRHKISETTPLGNQTLYAFCTCGSLDSVRDAGGNYTYFFYDNQARLTNTAFPDGFGVTNRLDLLGRITNSTDSGGSSVTNVFNNQGLLIAVNNSFGQVQSTTFDALDRPTSTTDANGVTVTSTFDNLDRPLTRTYPDAGVEQFGYTANVAAMTSYTNQLNLASRYGYDPLGRKTAETNANLEVTQFSYGPASDTLTLTDGKNQTTTWIYDQFGRATNKLDAASNLVFLYKYDPDSHLTNRWTPAKGSTGYAYDSMGNLTSIQYPVSGSIVLAYDVLSRLTNMVDSVGTTKYNYDSVGQLLSEDGPWNSDTVSYSYANRLRTGLSLQAPSASSWVQSYGYDAAKRLTSVTSPVGAFGYIYDAQRAMLPNPDIS